jgi:mono/diheme cytochrome c family protein
MISLRKGLPAAGVGLAALALGPALAADPVHGGDIAKRWCAACHVVSDEQSHGTDNVPTFASIGRRPGVSADSIATFLRDPHPKMPDMQLSRSESEDLAAYIVSLSK